LQRTFLAAALLIVPVAACGGKGSLGGNGADAGAGTLAISPPTLTVEVDDGVAVTHPYTATLTAPDGTMSDVTDQVTFAVDDANIGYFDHATLNVTGGGAGITKVHASLSAAGADADLKVLVKSHRVDPSAPSNAPTLFGSAATDTSKQVTVVYPADQVIVPLNLGNFDVHWSDASGDNLYEVTLKTDYVDLRFYTAAGATGWMEYLPAEWATAADNAKDLQVLVRSMNTAAPQTAGISTVTTVHLSNDAIQGGIYYWAAASSNGSPEGIWRHDMSKPGDPPQAYYTTQQTPNARCVACHALSRDGTKMAVTYDGGGQSSTILDVGSLTPVIPPGQQYWNFATFTPDGSKLLTVENGQLSLRSATDASLLATVPNAGVASHPDFAPDGKHFVYVQRASTAQSDWSFTSGGIYTVSYDDSNLTFGAPQLLVSDGGKNDYYPSYSPDGTWIMFNRTDDNSSAYNSPSAEVWVVKADGTGGPMKLSTADVGAGLTDSWARWAPFQSSFGPNSEALYWITFSSKRQFGVRLPQGTPQVWMTPFFPDKASTGADPTAPAFWLPFQDIGTSNHIAQWTEKVVPIN
jgi:hypothetical protein